jgi:hypothetical protein
MENIFRHLRVSSCGAPSLTRGRVSNLPIQLLRGLSSAETLRCKSRRTPNHVLTVSFDTVSVFISFYIS